VFQDVLGDKIIVALSEDIAGFEDFTKLLVECDVAEIAVFDEVDESGKVVEDGGEVILDLMVRKEFGVLHQLCRESCRF
jgi:hypothetical protein